jgi:hypothetical protein
MSKIGRATIIKVLQAILAAVTPLSITTIDAILGIETTRHVVESLSSVLNVTVDGPVHLLHPTFREFLEDKEVSGTFHVILTDAHKMLAKGCLAVMKKQLQFNICRLESSFYLNKDIPDLTDRISRFVSKELQYGCLYWPDHIIRSEKRTPNEEVSYALCGILENAYPLYWIEVISALGMVSNAFLNLQNLRNKPFVGA